MTPIGLLSTRTSAPVSLAFRTRKPVLSARRAQTNRRVEVVAASGSSGEASTGLGRPISSLRSCNLKKD